MDGNTVDFMSIKIKNLIFKLGKVFFSNLIFYMFVVRFGAPYIDVKA
jgi:hypothetical protein